ncbi:MAG: carbohydrate kinase family protein [Isosphaeraceae bacterium]|nr:carbohydrate kinase family protein [Isosphaeraceae bacterium]
MSRSEPMPSPPIEVARQGPPPIVCAGMVVTDHVCPPLDHLPAEGELVAVDDLLLNIGGGAANAAVDLARLGVRTSICARVGDDTFGRFASETLVAHGIDTRGLKVDRGRPTSQTLIVNVRGQDRRFIHAVGANLGFTADDIDPVLDPPPRVLYIGYFLILPELTAEALAQRFARVRRGGGFTVLDVVTPGPGNYIEPLQAVLPHTDVFTPNTDEAALILGERDPVRQALAFRDMGARRVVITCGERGSVAVSADVRVRLGTYPIRYVDGSGGGDAFDAGYMAGLLEGLPELDCLKLASAVGASCVRAVGTTAGVFTRAEALEFMRTHELNVERL